MNVMAAYAGYASIFCIVSYYFALLSVS